MKTPAPRESAILQDKQRASGAAQADNRSTTVAQRQLQVAIDASPRQVAQRAAALPAAPLVQHKLQRGVVQRVIDSSKKIGGQNNIGRYIQSGSTLVIGQIKSFVQDEKRDNNQCTLLIFPKKVIQSIILLGYMLMIKIIVLCKLETKN